MDPNRTTETAQMLRDPPVFKADFAQFACVYEILFGARMIAPFEKRLASAPIGLGKPG